MQFRINRLFAPLFTLLMFIGGPTGLRAQEQGESGESGASIQLRVLCSQPVEGYAELKLAQGETVLRDLGLVPSMVSDPVGVGRGELVLARQDGSADQLDPVLNVSIPDAGSRFVLALFPSPETSSGPPYQHVLIRTDNLRFGVSDLYLFNFTQEIIGGTLGAKGFMLAPGTSEVVTPEPERAGDRMYQARFYLPQEGERRMFSDTRWPVAASARVYLFFIPDPRRRSIAYVSFREYEPFE